MRAPPKGHWSVRDGDVAEALDRLQGRVRRTPVLRLQTRQGAARITLKLEYLQLSGSFKIRGATNRILLDHGSHRRVAAASGGNHGAAVAHACRDLGLAADIFVPEGSPRHKLERIRTCGANVHLVAGEFSEVARQCAAFAAEAEALFVHPFNDPGVIAGQATVGREILEQCPDVTKVAVAVGGGGLAAGIAAALHGRADVIAVEPEECQTLATALRMGEPTAVSVGGVAVDSLGAPSIGEIAFGILASSVQDVILVSEKAIIAAQLHLWTEFRIAAEAAAACCWAALESALESLGGDDHLVVVVCGGNTDLRLLTDGSTQHSERGC